MFIYTFIYTFFFSHEVYTRLMSSSGIVFIVDMLIASSKTLEGIMYRLVIFRITYQPPTDITAKTSTPPVTLNPMTRPLLTMREGEEGKVVVFTDVLTVVF